LGVLKETALKKSLEKNDALKKKYFKPYKIKYI